MHSHRSWWFPLLSIFLAPVALADSPLSFEQAQALMKQCMELAAANRNTALPPACVPAIEAMSQWLPNDPLEQAQYATTLGGMYYLQEDYARAEPLLLRGLQIREEKLGPGHIDVAKSLSSLADVYQDQGAYQKADSLLHRSLRIQETELGLEHLDVAKTLDALAQLYREQGKYAQSEPMFERSLQIRENASSPDQLLIASSLSSLSMLYREEGKYAKAENLSLRSLRIREKVLDSEHPYISLSLNNLARLYKEQGKYGEAEPLYLRSLQIAEKGGAAYRLSGRILNNLASLYAEQGEYHKAEELLLRSLRTFDKTRLSERSDVATALNNLALLHQTQKKYREAEELYLQSKEATEQLLGANHTEVATLLCNLGVLYQIQGEYRKAEPLLLRSLKIRQEALPAGHVDIGNSLQNLGGQYKVQGRYREAEPLFLRSLSIWEKALGLEHPDVATAVSNLARLDLAQGHLDAGLPRFARVLAIRESTLRGAVTESRISSLLESRREDEDIAYSLALHPETGVRGRKLALSTSLLMKGRAAEVGLMTGRALRDNLSTETQRERFDEWQMLRTKRETLFLQAPDKRTLAAHEEQLRMLQNQIDAQEQELARAAPALAAWKLPEPDQILSRTAAKLSRGEVLVEVLWMKPYQFQATGMEPPWGAPRYLALLLFPDQHVESVDLGPAQSVDAAASAFLAAARSSKSDPLPAAQALYQKVFAPLISKIESSKKLYLSLDGSLNLVPFAALHDGQRYLLDGPYELVYVSSGRDLLRGPLGEAKQGPLVLADPDYGSGIVLANADGKRTVSRETGSLYQRMSRLSSLPGAKAEGALLGRLLGVTPLVRAAATEEAVRLAKSPVLLHIATHGVFLDDDGPGPGPGPGIVQSSGAKMVGLRPAAVLEQELGQSKDRPLFRSALALAGAARAAEAKDAGRDGVLTAEEATTLSLCGTQLVVLSACNTGRGSVKAGQGVYGLRRAFFVAGAETVVMSLWAVSDSGTESLMQKYYRLLLDRKRPGGRVSGLTAAMKAVKAENGHPYYWAPFIALGSDGPLTLR